MRFSKTNKLKTPQPHRAFQKKGKLHWQEKLPLKNTETDYAISLTFLSNLLFSYTICLDGTSTFSLCGEKQMTRQLAVILIVFHHKFLVTF